MLKVIHRYFLRSTTKDTGQKSHTDTGTKQFGSPSPNARRLLIPHKNTSKKPN